MGKAVKKIATVAAVAYAGAGLYYGTFSPISIANQMKFGALGTGLAGKVATGATGASLFSGSTIQKVGLGLQVSSYLQQRKYQAAQANATKQQAEEQRRINMMQERVRLVQERRQRLDILRQQRIQQGSMEASIGSSGLGLSGTSGFTGATSSIQAQTTANLGALQASSGASTAISRVSQTAADYGSKANQASAQQQQWAQVGSLGGKLYDKGPEIFDLTKSIFKTA
jgi:hypothetical protein